VLRQTLSISELLRFPAFFAIFPGNLRKTPSFGGNGGTRGTPPSRSPWNILPCNCNKSLHVLWVIRNRVDAPTLLRKWP